MELERLQRDLWPDGGEELRAVLAEMAPPGLLAAQIAPAPRLRRKPTRH